MGIALGPIVGGLLNTRYQDTMTSTLAPHHVPHAITQALLTLPSREPPDGE